MDEELKHCLNSNFKGFGTHFGERLMGMTERVPHEVGSRFDDMNVRVESIDSRLKLQAGLIRAGAEATAKFSEFSESPEQRWINLEKRVAKPEQGKAS